MRIILPSIKWNHTNDGVDFHFESAWLDYERSLLPPDVVFPREGQIWEPIHDCEVSFEACIAQPEQTFIKLRLAEGGEVIMPEICAVPTLSKPDPRFPWGNARLSKGEKVRVVPGPCFSSFAGPKPLRVSLQPLRYEELHESIVPLELRQAPGYKGYRLHVATARPKWCLHEAATYLNQDFRLVEDVA